MSAAIAPVRGRRPGRAEQRARGEVVGRVTIVQEDRIRVIDGAGRGYLFVVRKRAASLRELERWRDARVPVLIRYVGLPDAGALAERIEPASRRRAPAPAVAPGTRR